MPTRPSNSHIRVAGRPPWESRVILRSPPALPAYTAAGGTGSAAWRVTRIVAPGGVLLQGQHGIAGQFQAGDQRAGERRAGAQRACGPGPAAAGSARAAPSGSMPSSGRSRRIASLARHNAALARHRGRLLGRHMQRDQAGAQQLGEIADPAGRAAARACPGRTPRARAAAGAPASRRRGASGRARAAAGAAPRPPPPRHAPPARRRGSSSRDHSSVSVAAITVQAAQWPIRLRVPAARAPPASRGQMPRSARRSTAAPDRSFARAPSPAASRAARRSRRSTARGAASAGAPRGGSSQAATAAAGPGWSRGGSAASVMALS